MYAMAYTEQFAQWLENVLNERGMSQAELARQAGVTRAAINGVLTGARGPGIDLCKGIAQALKIPPEEVYRAAGLLDTEPDDDERMQKIKTLYHTLRHDGSKERALEFIQFLSDQEDKNDRTGSKTKRGQ